MKDNSLAPKTTKLLKLRNTLYPKDITKASSSEINRFNSAEMEKKRAFKKLYRPKTKNITRESFIIPLEDNASIGAYLFRKQNKAANAQNSLIIFFHDGGWVLGNIDIYCAVCSNICNTTGAAVLAVDYRLAPEYKFPVPLEDCYAAYLWALLGARYWKTDPSDIYLMGSCAGANLAIAVCRMARDRKVQMPAGLILSEPITDCRLRTESLEKYKNNILLKEKDLNFYISNYMREPKDILNPLFSPLLAIDHSRFPDTLIFATEKTPLFDDAKLYSQALESADTPCKLIVYNDSLHGILNFPTCENWERTMNTVASFINGIGIDNLTS